MSPPCPEMMELFQWLDGEVTTNRARQLEAHVAGCPTCRRELAAQQQLISRLREPPGPADEQAIQAVMARLQAQPPPRRSFWQPVWPVGLAAACLLGLGALLWQAGPKSTPELFAARGGPSAPWLERYVGVELLSAGQPPVLLRPGPPNGRSPCVSASSRAWKSMSAHPMRRRSASG